MNPIRPNLPVATPRPQRPEARAAQQAFFQAAVNRATTAAASTPVREVAAAPGARRETLSEEQPSRYLRPGSLLDIKV